MPLPCTEEQIGLKHLTIRFKESDDGSRPVPEDQRTSRSPDIWLDHGGDTTVDIYTANAAPNSTNVIMARVWNFTNQPLQGINVEAWVCNYMTGFGPTAQIESAGPNPRTGYASGPLDPGSYATITCDPPWQPYPSDVNFNGGHVCLAANCWADDPVEGQPLSYLMDLRCDAHHAHRNIAVKAVPRSNADLILELPVMAINPDLEQDQSFIVSIRPVDSQDLQESWEELLALLQTGPLAGAEVRPPWTSPLELSLLGDRLEPMEEGTYFISLAPGEQAPLVMRVVLSPDEEVGNVHLIDAVQVLAEGEEIGSARLMAVVVP